MGDEKKEEERSKPMAMQDQSPSAANSGFKFNAQAPEFVPRSFPQIPISGCFYPYLQFHGNGDMASDWLHFADQEPMHFVPDSHIKVPCHNKNTNDVIQKIVKQVEYQFSDSNLIASDFLLKIINKDPEGYVPISVITSWKKIKSLGTNIQMIIKALRTSSKLAVSEDGKKVRRRQLFTERNKEELISRTVVVENLPEDSSRQNIENIFSTVGSIKNIRICHPQESALFQKTDVLISNKLHAFVEFETSDQAEKAVEKLNDERNWRTGLRVRPLLRCSPRSVIRCRKSDNDHFDLISEDEQSPSYQNVGSSPKIEQVLQDNVDANQNIKKKEWGRFCAKPHGLLQNYNGRGVLSQTLQRTKLIGLGPYENYSKQASPRPRMPDGTRGFTIGRGKPLAQLITKVDLAPIKL